MNKQETKPGMLDQVLATEDALVPSSGFAAGVMERVTEAAARSYKPLAFPWRRVLPGIILLVAGLAYMGMQLIKTLSTAGVTQASNFAPLTAFTIVYNQQNLLMLQWLAAAAALTLITWSITQRLVGLR